MYCLAESIRSFVFFDLFSIDSVDTSLAPLLMQDILHLNIFACCLYFVSFTSILLVGIDILLEWSEWSGWRRRFFASLPQVATVHRHTAQTRHHKPDGASYGGEPSELTSNSSRRPSRPSGEWQDALLGLTWRGTQLKLEEFAQC